MESEIESEILHIINDIMKRMDFINFSKLLDEYLSDVGVIYVDEKDVPKRPGVEYDDDDI